MPPTHPWTFLSDYAHVLVCVAREPYADARLLAGAVGISPSKAATILSELEAGGYVLPRVDDEGTRWVINRQRPLRHPVEAHHTVGRLLEAVEDPAAVLRARLRTGG